MMRRSRRIRLGRRLPTRVGVEEGGDQGVEVEVVGSGAGGEGEVGEVSRGRVQKRGECSGVCSNSGHGNDRQHGIRLWQKQSKNVPI